MNIQNFGYTEGAAVRQTANETKQLVSDTQAAVLNVQTRIG